MTSPTPPAATSLATAIAMADDQPRHAFAAIHARLAETVGARLFTVLAFDFPRQQMVRTYSSDEAVYRSGVADPIADTIWERTLIGARRPLVLNSHAELASLLPDADELRALGCEAMLNLPVVVAGQAIGALNLLAGAGNYTDERIAAAQEVLPAAAAMLLWVAAQ